MTTPYWEKLKDPRWQKKRLEILEGCGWKCKSCGTSTKSLHVHHEFYEKGAEPWEAPIGTLVSLCDECHEERESIEHDLKMELGRFCAVLNNEEIKELFQQLIFQKLKKIELGHEAEESLQE